MSTVEHAERPANAVRLFGRDVSRLIGSMRRYGLSAFGPLSVSGAHFIASLVLLHMLPRAEFGLFSFVIVISALSMGVTIALLGAPVSTMVDPSRTVGETEMNMYLKVNLVLAVALAATCFAAMLFFGAAVPAAALFGLYAGLMSLRLFARTFAYTVGQVRKVIASDCLYSFTLVIGLALMVNFAETSLFTMAVLACIGAALALAPFGSAYLVSLGEACTKGSLLAYREVWRNMTRWSLLGVVTTEVTSNAHAYLVTFSYGSKAFALLAVGSLFMRPLGLVLAALPDQERPAMARTIAAGEVKRTLRIANEFRIAMGGLWLATVALSAVILIWFPTLLVKNGYAQNDVVAVVVLWAAIMAVRALRGPDAVLLQAAREFRPLANASVWSSVVAFLLTFALLLLAGPIASLGRI